MSDNHQPLPDDPVDRAVAATRQLPLPAGPSAATVSRTLACLRQVPPQPRASIFQKVIRMPRSLKITAVLTSAATLLLVYAVLSSVTGSSALAFADVIEVLNKVRSAKWKTTSEVKLPDGKTVNTTGVGMFLAPSHERMETTAMGVTTIQISDGAKDKLIGLSPATKTVQVFNVKNLPAGREGPFGRMFEGLQHIISSAKAGGLGKVERLDGNSVDGHPAEGFRMEVGAMEVKIWADPKSGEPVRAEYTGPGDSATHVVMSDFEVDIDLDPALFSIDVPDGYTITTTTDLDMSKKPIVFLADALKMIADINDGVFPPEIRGKDGIDGIMQRSAAKLMTLTRTSDGNGTVFSSDAPTKLGGAFGFLFALSPETNDWHYAGKDVKLNTPDRPIFWYRKAKDAKVYDVLYADLSVKELPADQLPKVDAK